MHVFKKENMKKKKNYFHTLHELIGRPSTELKQKKKMSLYFLFDDKLTRYCTNNLQLISRLIYLHDQVVEMYNIQRKDAQ
jgi:hypothetical protein